LAQWSIHKAIINDGFDPFDFAQKASEMGFDGLEYVSQLYTPYLKKGSDPKISFQNVLDTLKLKSETYGMKNINIMVDNEGDLASADDNERKLSIENHKKWIDAAEFLGCPTIRVNLRGSHKADIWTDQATKSLKSLATYAESKNVNVIVENHGGFSSNGVLLTQVIKNVNKNNCGTLPDFGNFCQTEDYGSINDINCKEAYDIYKGVQEMMPYAKAVSAKSYDFDENGNQPKIDYKRMLQIVKDAGYKGYIGVEYEGDNLSEDDGIIATKKLILKLTKELK
jgi:sugar phosphate isomerase/epimerase